MTAATAKQIGMIHGLAKRAGLEDDAYRDFLQQQTGQRSSKALSIEQAHGVIERLRVLTHGDSGPRSTAALARGSVAGLTGPVAAKLRALWIAGYELGVVRDRTDRAMLAFLERQCGVSHPRFINDPGGAAAAIEALKSWIARETGIAWPAKALSPAEFKHAVMARQWHLLERLHAVQHHGMHGYVLKITGKQHHDLFTGDDYAAVHRALGRKLRQALADAAKQTATQTQTPEPADAQ